MNNGFIQSAFLSYLVFWNAEFLVLPVLDLIHFSDGHLLAHLRLCVMH